MHPNTLAPSRHTLIKRSIVWTLNIILFLPASITLCAILSAYIPEIKQIGADDLARYCAIAWLLFIAYTIFFPMRRIVSAWSYGSERKDTIEISDRAYGGETISLLYATAYLDAVKEHHRQQYENITETITKEHSGIKRITKLATAKCKNWAKQNKDEKIAYKHDSRKLYLPHLNVNILTKIPVYSTELSYIAIDTELLCGYQDTLEQTLTRLGIANTVYKTPYKTMRERDGLPANETEKNKFRNLKISPHNRWQTTAAKALIFAGLVNDQNCSIVRSKAIDLIDKSAGEYNFIVDGKALSAAAIYDWARAELFDTQDVSFTDAPEWETNNA